MKKTILVTACILGMLGVVFGAFAAHGLKNLVDTDALVTFETGVRYQMYHVFFLFVIGVLPDKFIQARKLIYSCTVIGVILFSFSIYILALNDLVQFDFKIFGIVTPIGGLFLIAAWVLLGHGIWKSTVSK